MTDADLARRIRGLLAALVPAECHIAWGTGESCLAGMEAKEIPLQVGRRVLYCGEIYDVEELLLAVADRLQGRP